jgi:hypothetical protein
MIPQRIRLRRAKGWRMPENTVNVARPGKLGNPYIVGQDGTREQCAALYLSLMRGLIGLSDRVTPEEQIRAYRAFHRARPSLKGQNIACWCALDGGACHGDIIFAAANPELPLPAWLAKGIELPRARIGMHIKDYERSLRAAAKRKKKEAEA